ncbi:hypothetical protein Tco_1396430, partial [Tanacetum coccineum]
MYCSARKSAVPSMIGATMKQKIYHDLNVIGGANANREDQEIDTNDEDQVVEETAVALSYKQVEQMLLS